MAEGPGGLGRALQAVLVRESPQEDLPIEGPSLANANRRQVFRYLCRRPCAHPSEISKALSVSQATIRWHEGNLLERGYVEADSGHVVPRGLVPSGDVDLFTLLATPGRDDVLRACHREPGLSLQRLAGRVQLTRQSTSKIASELSEAGLVAVIEDGRSRRVFPTDVLERKRQDNRPRAWSFAEQLLGRLRADGLSPELLRRDEAVVLLRLGASARWVVFDLPVDPYMTAWQPAL